MTPAESNAFRPDLEALRGVAILLVVAYHAGVPGFSGGYVGVDCFFVLSGYLITGQLARAGKVKLAAFYARRARRLLPAFTLALLGTVAAAYFLRAPLEQNRIANSALFSAGYLGNLYFAHEATDYLRQGAAANPFLHLWSLGVEEQFYMLWPLLVMLGLKTGRLRRTVVVTLVVSFALSLVLTHYRQPWAFFSSPTRAWEFAAGAVVTLSIAPTRRRLGLLGFLLLVASGFLFGDGTTFPGVAAALPVLGTALALTGGEGSAFDLGWLRWLGKLSYGWYLWHWPAIVLSGASSVAGKALMALLALGLAWVSFQLVESPARRRLSGKLRPLAVGLALSCLCLVTAGWWRRASWYASLAPGQAPYTRAALDWPRVYADGCLPDFFGKFKECGYGQGPAVVLFGDSHAAQWQPALEKLAEADGFRLVTLVRANCSAADVAYNLPVLGRRYTECEEWRRQALARIVELRPGAVVASSSLHYVGDGMVGVEEWREGTRRTLLKVSESGARVYLLRDPPAAGFDVPSCLAARAWYPRWLRPATCSFPLKEAGVADAERRAAEGLARYVDLTESVCPGGTCPPESGGVVTYADTSHLTATYSSLLAPALGRELGPDLGSGGMRAQGSPDAEAYGR
ncbi:MAG: acyltransferase [Acidobacteria bacterium]|nr:acyltransferase [Acidobacteriota bacterium]